MLAQLCDPTWPITRTYIKLSCEKSMICLDSVPSAEEWDKHTQSAVSQQTEFHMQNSFRGIFQHHVTKLSTVKSEVDSTLVNSRNHRPSVPSFVTHFLSILKQSTVQIDSAVSLMGAMEDSQSPPGPRPTSGSTSGRAGG